MDDQQARPRDDEPHGDPFRPYDANPYNGDGPVRKQSGLGIASFVLGILCMLGLILAVTMLMSSSIQDLAGQMNQAELEAAIMNDGALIGGVLLFLLALGVGVVGLILGIIGLVIRNRRKVFAIIGTVLNGLIIVGFFALMALGLAMGTGV